MNILKNKKKKIVGVGLVLVAVIASVLAYIKISNNIKRERNEKIIEEDKKLLEDIKQNKIVRPTYNNKEDDEEDGHVHNEKVHDHK